MAYFRSGISNIQKYRGDAVDVAGLPAPIASFQSNVSGVKLDSLKVLVEAVQDLHGYDKPWAGGGGANKWDEEWELGAINTTNGQDTPANNRIRSKNYIVCVPDTTYFVKSPAQGGLSVFFYDTNKDFIRYDYRTNATVTAPSNAYYIRFCNGGADLTTYNHDIAINYPSTVTTYSPYENICPISGWNGCDVTRTGANIWDEQWKNGYYANGVYTFLANYVCSKNPIEIKPNTTYYAFNGEARGRLVIAQYDINGDFISNILARNASFTTDSKAYSINFYLEAQLQSYNNNVSINYPSTDTAYHAYNGNTYTIAFGDTYYGCELDVTNGVLRVVKKGRYVDSELSISYDSTNQRFFVTLPDMANNTSARNKVILCSTYENKVNVPYEASWDSVIYNAGGDRPKDIAIHDRRYTTVSDFVAYTSQNCFIVYPLATPIEIQLTPTQIAQLLGDNNVFADCGDVEEVKKIQISQIGG